MYVNIYTNALLPFSNGLFPALSLYLSNTHTFSFALSVFSSSRPSPLSPLLFLSHTHHHTKDLHKDTKWLIVRAVPNRHHSHCVTT